MKKFIAFIAGVIIASCIHFFIDISDIYDWDSGSGSSDCACNDDGRYSGHETDKGGVQIPNSEACRMVKDYAQNEQDPHEEYYGGFISKKVIDKIFCATKDNGLMIFMATDGNDKVRLVVRGTNLPYVSTAGGPVADREYYLVDAMCPRICDGLDLSVCGGTGW